MNPKNQAMLIAVLLLFMSVSSFAVPIKGFVTDATSGESLPVASVQVKDSDFGASTNLDGYFVVDVPEAGVYILVVSYIGYHSSEIEVVVNEGVSNPLKLELQPASIRLQEVVVKAKDESDLTRNTPRVSTVPVDAKIIRMMPSLGAEMDVLRAMNTIPGVKASSDLSSALYVRGGSSDQTLILMDHNTVYNPSHLFGLFSTFNADAVKRIDLIKGGFPAEYGGRSGSVLDVITNEGNRKEYKGLVSLGLISARGSLEGPLPNNKGSFQVAGRRTYMDYLIDVARQSTDTDLPDYYFYDGNAKINVDLTPRSTFTAAGYWGNDRLDFKFGDVDNRLRAYLSWGNRTLTTRYRYALGADMFWSAHATVSRYRSKWSFENEDVLFEEAYHKLLDYQLKSDLEFLGSRDHHFKIGVVGLRWDFELNDRSEDVTWIDVTSRIYNFSFYAQDIWHINSFWEIQGGLRSYYHADGDQFRVDPRLAVMYRYDTDTRFKLSGGRFSQWINVITFGDAFSNFDTWVPVDKSMKPGYSDQIIAGWEWDREDNTQLTTEVYYTKMYRVATFDPTVDRTSGLADEAFIIGEGNAYGAEWMLRRNTGRLTGWLGYSLSWTQRRWPGSIINQGDWFYPKWDRRHDFIVVSNYKLNQSWDLSTTWRYNTGQGFTQALGLFRNEFAHLNPQYEGNDGILVLPGSKNNYRFPEDHRLDVTASYNHLFLKRYNAKLTISVYNIYNRRPYWQRFFDNSENPVEITDVKLLPILPLVGYEVRF